MMYRRKNRKLKMILVVLIPIVLLVVVFRFDIKEYIFGNKLKVLGNKESVFFIKDKMDTTDGSKNMPVLDQNKGIMIFTVDNSDVNIEDIAKKFAGEKLIGRIKRDADGYDGYSLDQEIETRLLKDTKVEILSHYKDTWYYVKPIEEGIATWVSEEKLSFPYTSRVKVDELTDEEIEVYINSLDIKSDSERMLYVDLPRQVIYVFENYSGKWDHSESLKCMTGTPRSSMPKGEYKIIKKDELVLSNAEKVVYKYLSKISNGFDIRSMPESIELPKNKDEVKNLNLTDEKKDNRSSDGNIWLSESDAKWIYENINFNTTIIIK